MTKKRKVNKNTKKMYALSLVKLDLGIITLEQGEHTLITQEIADIIYTTHSYKKDRVKVLEY